VVQNRRGDPAEEAAFSSAGANLVLGPVFEPLAWQCRIHDLLRVPKRRALRLPVRLALRPSSADSQAGIDGRLLNLSTHGVLLECARPLAVGDRLDLSFRLPGDDDPLQANARGKIESFIRHIRRRPQVMDVYFLAGADDFILHVAARDTDDLRSFVVENLNADSDVAGTQTSLIFEHLRGASPL